MPSGAKKRKAARKKKEQEASSINNPLGNDDVKSQDEKDSDGGELGSPASQDEHHHEPSFSDGNGVEKRDDDPSVEKFNGENKSSEEVKGDLEDNPQLGLMDKVGVEIVRESENEEDSESKDIIIEQVEYAKESQNQDESSSSSSSRSSSSEDESQVTADKKLKEETFNPVVESATPSGDPVKPFDSFTEETPVEEVYNSGVENVPILNSVKQPVGSLTEEVIYVSESAPVESLVVSNGVELGLKENEEQPKLAEVTELPPTITDFGSSRVDDEVLPMTDGKAESSNIVVEYTSEENAGKILLATVPPGAETTNSNGAEHSKVSEFPECSENKPLVAPAPRVVQTTSWKSCCGLFEVLTGSH